MKNAQFARVMGFNWIVFAVYLLLMALLSSLGFWQLDRAEQKRWFLQQQQQGMQAAPVNLNQAESAKQIQRYQSVQVKGHYDAAHSFLVDNQIVGGRPGYFVMTPFILDQQASAVLVNRGWLPLSQNRQSLPDVEIEVNQPSLEIRGRINDFPQVGIQLKGAEIPTETWPSVVQVLDNQILAAKLGYPLYPFQVE